MERSGSGSPSHRATIRAKRSSWGGAASRARIDSEEELLDRRHRRPLGLLAAGGDLGHGLGVHERGRAVEDVERLHQRVEAGAVRRHLARPAGQAHPVPEPAGEREQVDVARVAQLVERHRDGGVELGQVGGDVLPAEQVGDVRAPVEEQLVGQLAGEHHPVGDALAGLGLGQGVEAADALRRQQEEGRVPGPVDHEGVADRAPGLGQGRDRDRRGSRPRAGRPRRPAVPV